MVKAEQKHFFVRGLIVGVVYQIAKYFYYKHGLDYKYPNFNQENVTNCMYSGFNFHDENCQLL